MKIDKRKEKIKNNSWKDVLIFVPSDYELDIYVNPDDKIDWSNIEKSNKKNL